MAELGPTARETGYSWDLPNANDPPASPLIPAITQYPIFEAIIANLQVKDLVPLAQTCQSIYKLLNIKDEQWRSALLSKALCSGEGLDIRRAKHHLCAVQDFTVIRKCRGIDGDESIESQPCETCGVNTCDECRIHLVYNYLVKDEGFENRRWWAGHILLDPCPSVFQPPTGVDDSQWHLPIRDMQPLHDQGLLSVPFGIPAVADPEPLEHLMNIDLGRRYLVGLGRAKYPYQMDNLISGLRNITASRIRVWCEDCALDAGPELCDCTLKSRFVDRWECISCYLGEETDPQTFGMDVGDEPVCPCGAPLDLDFQEDDVNIGCIWCDRMIDVRGMRRLQAADAEGIESENDGATNGSTPGAPVDDSDDDASDYGDTDASDHEPGCQLARTWAQADGTMGLILGHKKIPSHCIGHEIFREWHEVNNLPALEKLSAQEELVIDDMD